MTKHDELPLPDYEHLPLETLKHRIRMLDANGVQKLLDYERAHGNRLPVVQAMETWLEELREGLPLPMATRSSSSPRRRPRRPAGRRCPRRRRVRGSSHRCVASPPSRPRRPRRRPGSDARPRGPASRWLKAAARRVERS
jgi:hypothetical protein